MLVILQIPAIGQQHLRGTYTRNDPYNFTGIRFDKGDSCTVEIIREFGGHAVFHTTYICTRHHYIHINVAPPPNTQKARVAFRGNNMENRSIEVVDCGGIDIYIGAKVILNGQLKYVLDATSTIKLPPGIIVKTLEISSVGRRDTIVKVDDPGKGNAIAAIPFQYEVPTIYGDVETDWYLKRTWLFSRRRLYAVRKGVILKEYYLKRVKVKSKGT